MGTWCGPRSRVLSLHAFARHGPHAGLEVEFVPSGADDFAHAQRREGEQRGAPVGCPCTGCFARATRKISPIPGRSVTAGIVLDVRPSCLGEPREGSGCR